METKYSIKKLENIVDLSRSTIYDKVKEGSFPPPIKRGRYSYWYKKAVDVWIQIQDKKQLEWMEQQNV